MVIKFNKQKTILVNVDRFSTPRYQGQTISKRNVMLQRASILRFCLAVLLIVYFIVENRTKKYNFIKLYLCCRVLFEDKYSNNQFM